MNIDPSRGRKFNLWLEKEIWKLCYQAGSWTAASSEMRYCKAVCNHPTISLIFTTSVDKFGLFSTLIFDLVSSALLVVSTSW